MRHNRALAKRPGRVTSRSGLGIAPEDIRPPSAMELICTGQRYGIAPESAKCVVFSWLDKGLPWSVVRFLAKRHLDLTPASLSSYGVLYRKHRRV